MPAFQPEELLDLLLECRQAGVVTVVDVVIPQNATIPKNLGPLLNAIDYFLPNDDEASAITGFAEPLDQLRSLIQAGANTVIITQGRRGAITGRDGDFWRSGIYQMDAMVDPSGCGDAFAAGVVTGVVHGWDLPATLRYASALGASAGRALGTTDGVFTADQAEKFINSRQLDIQTGRL